MSLTPRQIAAYLVFNHKIDQVARAHDLAIIAIGSQGDKKSIDETLKKLTK